MARLGSGLDTLLDLRHQVVDGVRLDPERDVPGRQGRDRAPATCPVVDVEQPVPSVPPDHHRTDEPHLRAEAHARQSSSFVTVSLTCSRNVSSNTVSSIVASSIASQTSVPANAERTAPRAPPDPVAPLEAPVVLDVEVTEPSLFSHPDDGVPARAVAAFRSL